MSSNIITKLSFNTRSILEKQLRDQLLKQLDTKLFDQIMFRLYHQFNSTAWVSITRGLKLYDTENIKCSFGRDDIHIGYISERHIFDNQLSLPMCDRHYSLHCAITTLTSLPSYDIDSVLAMSPEQCFEELTKHGSVALKT